MIDAVAGHRGPGQEDRGAGGEGGTRRRARPGKWDLQKDTAQLREAVRDLVRFQFPVLGFAPIIPVSALTGYGVRALLDTALEVWDQLHAPRGHRPPEPVAGRRG